MRILHTADWHLGKRLDNFSRLEEQQAVLAEICRIAEEQKVDMVIVAGDLFDTFNPPIEATELLYKTLKRLSRNGKVPAIAIAGNHDSPDRVNVADVLARENGIIFIGHPTDKITAFELEEGFKITRSETGFVEFKLPEIEFPVRVIHTAFANEVRLKEYFGEDKQLSLQGSLAKKWQKSADDFCDEKGVNVLTTHLYMLKRGGEILEEPEGEKPLNIGNADVVYSDAVPASIQYVALGHLHRYQDVGSNQPVIYSSSPLAYSFSEAGQQKYVAIVDLKPGETARIEKIPLQSGRRLERKTFDEVKKAESWLLENPDTLVELTIESDTFLTAEERRILFQAHDGIIFLIPKVRSTTINERPSGTEINLNQDMETLFKEYFQSRNKGQVPNEELMNLFNEIRSI